MSDELLIIIGASAFFLCLGAIVALILTGILDGEREYRAASQESYAEASLRPRSGNVTVSRRQAPFDQERERENYLRQCEAEFARTYNPEPANVLYEAEIQQAQAFVWALHRIEAASSEDRWDWALGQGRN